MNKKDIIRMAGIAWGGALLAAQAADAEAVSRQARPNVLFVMVDDLPPDAVGYEGRYPFLKTPNVDRLAHEGAVFKNMYVTTSLCSPSRACFMTGTYAHKNKVWDNSGRDPDPALPTFATELQAAGYQTGFIGKWHMDHSPEPRKGFDYWLSFPGQGKYIDPPMNENGRNFKAHGYMTDLLNEYALNFLKNRDTSKPFALCLWHKANHEPFIPAERHKNAFAGTVLPAPKSYFDDLSEKPNWIRRGMVYGVAQNEWPLSENAEIPEKVEPQPWSTVQWAHRLDFLRCMLAVDESLGQLMDELDRQGILDDTLIIFTADNGFLMGEFNRGDKRVAWDQSMRIPFCVRYPRMVKAGSEVDKLTLNIDVAPTLIDLAKASVPSEMQGTSMVPLLKGNSSASWRDSILYEYFQERPWPGIVTMQAVRTEKWKYIYYPIEAKHGEMAELYDLEQDPDEMNNLALNPEYKAQCTRMQGELDQLLKQFDYQNSPYDYYQRSLSGPIEWFFGMDKDRDKKVSEDEWVDGNRADNHRKGWKFDEERCREKFSARDLDGDGFLTKDEFNEFREKAL